MFVPRSKMVLQRLWFGGVDSAAIRHLIQGPLLPKHRDSACDIENRCVREVPGKCLVGPSIAAFMARGRWQLNEFVRDAGRTREGGRAPRKRVRFVFWGKRAQTSAGSCAL